MLPAPELSAAIAAGLGRNRDQSKAGLPPPRSWRPPPRQEPTTKPPKRKKPSPSSLPLPSGSRRWRKSGRDGGGGGLLASGARRRAARTPELWSAAHGGNAAREAIRAFSVNVRMKPTGAMDGRIGDQTGYAG
jgi:hypothetical protein